MGAPSPGAGDETQWRSRRRAAAAAWAAFAFVVWNVVFDAAVLESGRDYLTRQARHQQGQGPAVTIPQVMGRGIARGAARATAAGGAVAACGTLGVWLAGRRRRARSAGAAE
ncbi:MAG TPA: hypothetical protein PKZ08_07025 [Vicinamibacterales bacterium]|nr:hypothetical protein [Vicinamibacterales bacterium]